MDNRPPARPGPIVMELKGDRTYLWCRCGRSASQPLCDGSHRGTGIQPMVFKPTADMKVRMCVCKRTGKPPFCDGSHLDP